MIYRIYTHKYTRDEIINSSFFPFFFSATILKSYIDLWHFKSLLL